MLTIGIMVDAFARSLQILSNASISDSVAAQREILDALQNVCSHLYDRYAVEEQLTREGTERILSTSSFAPTSRVTLVNSKVEATNTRPAADYGVLLRKTTLYSDLVAVALPYVSDWRYHPTEFMSASRAQFVAPDVATINMLQEVVELNSRFKDIVEAGRCVFLPRQLEIVGEQDISGFMDLTRERHVLSPPLVDSSDRWLPLNSIQRDGGYSNFFVFKQIVLPYYPNLDLRTIDAIAHQETDSFVRFNRFLRIKLEELSSSSDRGSVHDLIGEIDAEVARVSLEAKKIGGSRAMRGIEIATFAISLAASALLDAHTVDVIAAATGSVTLLDILRSRVSRDGHRLELAKDDFFFPYLLRDWDVNAD